MNFELYNYIKNYTQEKYFMHHSADNNFSDSLSFIDFVARHHLITRYSMEEIKSGKADKIIDQLVREYNKNKKLDDVSFADLCKYIKRLVKNKYKQSLKIVDEDVLNSMVMRVALKVVDPNDKEFSKYINKTYDKIILSDFEAVSDMVYEDCKFYLTKVVRKIDVKFKQDAKAYDDILNLSLGLLLKEKSVEDITSGFFDDFIITKFKSAIEIYIRKIYDYLKELINRGEIVLDKNFINDLVNKIVKTGELKASDLFAGKLDKYIQEYFVSIKPSNDAKNNENKEDVYRYIFNILKNSNTYNLSDGELKEITSKIYNIICVEEKYSHGRITSGICDSLIQQNFVNIYMMNLSTVQDNKPKKIKHRTKKSNKLKQIEKQLVILAIMAMLATGVAVNVVEDFQDSHEVVTAIHDLEKFGDYHFTDIYSADNDMVQPAARKAVEFYEKVSDLGIEENQYRYLGFYLSYSHVFQDRLNIMDTMLKHAKSSAATTVTYLSDGRVMGGSECSYDLVDKTCFLEFAIDRLEEMGCEEISDDKYVAALAVYMNAKANPDARTPMDAISDEYKEVIEEIMELYKEYSERELVKFNNLLKENYSYETTQLQETSNQASRPRRNV